MKETRYIGKVCTKHPEMMGERRKSSKGCIRCEAEAGREYWRQYVKKNPEKVRANRARWRSENAEKIKKYSKQYRFDNAEQVKRAVIKWNEGNPEKIKQYSGYRRAAKLQATPAWANKFFIAEAYHLAKLREKVCGGVWHVDHIVPLKSKVVCGLHVEHNLRVISGKENLLKGNRYWPDMPG